MLRVEVVGPTPDHEIRIAQAKDHRGAMGAAVQLREKPLISGR